MLNSLKNISLLFLLLIWRASVSGQAIINAYAKVDAVSGTTLTLSNVNESYDTFEAGEMIIIMQMQDDVIGGNTNNDAGFGAVATIANAGLYESVEIASISESGGVPVSVELSDDLINTYSTGANSSLQIISFPKYANYTTTADLTALAWDGNVGGVFALQVENTLTLANNIDVSERGFRGGNPNATADGTGCTSTVYATASDRHAQKGESIYKITNGNYVAGRAKVANGGGGGSFHNAGGGGGANFTSGGDGGPGWNGSNEGCNPSGGGQGGADLSDYISENRLFLGGGGGGGQQNNNVANTGGIGGGIILLKANEVLTTGGCGGLSIASMGQSRPWAGNDGGGGAGAGGSILFEVNVWSLACQVDINANGGNGGSVNSGQAHGGGGGGGRGVVVFSGSMPLTNMTVDNTEGVGGANDNSGNGGNAASGNASPSSGTADGDGIVESSSGVLPVELLTWEASAGKDHILLEWSTASEVNNDYFTIEKSNDGHVWQVVEYVDGHGTTSEQQKYALRDYDVSRQSVFYKLVQTDIDGKYEVFDVLKIDGFFEDVALMLYPNPNNGVFNVNVAGGISEGEFDAVMYDKMGRVISPRVTIEGGNLVFDMAGMPLGNYVLNLRVGTNQAQVFRVVVQ